MQTYCVLCRYQILLYFKKKFADLLLKNDPIHSPNYVGNVDKRADKQTLDSTPKPLTPFPVPPLRPP